MELDNSTRDRWYSKVANSTWHPILCNIVSLTLLTGLVARFVMPALPVHFKGKLGTVEDAIFIISFPLVFVFFPRLMHSIVSHFTDNKKSSLISAEKMKDIRKMRVFALEWAVCFPIFGLALVIAWSQIYTFKFSIGMSFVFATVLTLAIAAPVLIMNIAKEIESENTAVPEWLKRFL